MTYKEELRQMSNEELLSDLRFNTEYKLYKKRKDVETELLARLNRNPMSENCGNRQMKEKKKNFWCKIGWHKLRYIKKYCHTAVVECVRCKKRWVEGYPGELCRMW